MTNLTQNLGRLQTTPHPVAPPSFRAECSEWANGVELIMEISARNTPCSPVGSPEGSWRRSEWLAEIQILAGGRRGGRSRPLETRVVPRIGFDRAPTLGHFHTSRRPEVGFAA